MVQKDSEGPLSSTSTSTAELQEQETSVDIEHGTGDATPNNDDVERGGTPKEDNDDEGGEEPEDGDTLHQEEMEVDEVKETDAETKSTSSESKSTDKISEDGKKSQLTEDVQKMVEKVSDSSQKSNSEDEMLECRMCHKCFLFTSLKEHVVEHTKKPTDVCSSCGYFGKDGGPLTKHPSCFVCWKCSMFFKTSQLMKDHEAIHKSHSGMKFGTKVIVLQKKSDVGNGRKKQPETGADTKPTSTGSKSPAATREAVLKASKKVSDNSQQSTSEEEVLECRFCYKSFFYSSLKKHVKEHTKTATDVCRSCGFFSKDGGPVKDHPSCFVCWRCATFFKTAELMKDHMAIHKAQAVKKLGTTTKKADVEKDGKEQAKAGAESKSTSSGPRSPSSGPKSPATITEVGQKVSKKISGDSQKSTSGEQVLECRFCHKFYLYSSLKEHALEHTKTATEVCPSCGFFRKDGGPIKDHPSCFVCWTCSVFFDTGMKLREHMLLHDVPDENEEWFICQLCLARFCNARALRAHSVWHKEQGDKVLLVKDRLVKASEGKENDGQQKLRTEFVTNKEGEQDMMKLCIKCNMFFKSQKSLRKHVKREHTHTKTEVCVRCGFFQMTGGPVGIHACETQEEKKQIARAKRKKKKPGERYDCNKCTKTYAFKQGLRAHLLTHVPVGERPYCCHVCPKKFAKKILLDDHLRIHTGEKPYLCHMCAKTFRSGANLRQHSRRCKGLIPQPPAGMNGQEEQPVVFEVQMQVLEGGDNTVVINFDEISQEIRNYTQRTRNDHQPQGEVEVASEVVIAEQKSDETVFPIKIHSSVNELPVERKDGSSDHILSIDSVLPVERKDGSSDHILSIDSVLPADKVDVSSDQQGKKEAVDKGGIEMHKGDDDDWVDDEGPTQDSEASNPPAVATDHADHDYSNVSLRPATPVVTEVEKKDRPQLLEIMFMCPLCKGLFDSKMNIKDHIKSIHEKATKFDGIVVLAHSKRNSPDSKDSDSDSDSEDEMGINEDTLPIEWSYSCSHCFKLFTEDEIKEHLNTVKVEGDMCEVCFRVHRNHSKVGQSMVKCKLSRARKVFQCPYCKDMNPVTLCELKNHLKKKHTVDRTFQCPHCEKSYPRRKSLAMHMKVHKQKAKKDPGQRKKFVCDKCGKVCGDRLAARIHKMQHINPKPFQCKLCPKALLLSHSFTSAHARTQ